ncbi:MAG: heme o synthase, partial [Acidimicrobiales bacterium]
HGGPERDGGAGDRGRGGGTGAGAGDRRFGDGGGRFGPAASAGHRLRGVLSLARPTVAGQLRAYLALTKPRIVELLLVTTVPTMVLAAGGLPAGGLVVATLVGGALAAGGANAINCYLDRDIDAVMARTRDRPLVTGTVTPSRALVFALALEVAAFALLWRTVNPLSALLALGATAFYIGVYTVWLKRTSTANIVIGGAAGAVPVLVGWAAVRGSLDWAPLVLFGIIFLWTPPHFWALAVRYRADYAAAGIPMLPAVAGLRVTAVRILGYTVLLWALTLALYPVAGMGTLYLVAASALGGVFTWHAVQLVRTESPAVAMRVFTWSISYLGLLFLAMALDQLVRTGI